MASSAAAFAWGERQRAGLGDEFLTDLHSWFLSIQDRPESFAVSYGDVRRAVLHRFPYAVFYIVQPTRILVLAVLHSARDPKLWPRP